MWEPLAPSPPTHPEPQASAVQKLPEAAQTGISERRALRGWPSSPRDVPGRSAGVLMPSDSCPREQAGREPSQQREAGPRDAGLPCALPGGKGQDPLPSPGRSFYYKGKGSGVIEQRPVPACSFSLQMLRLRDPLHSGSFQRVAGGFRQAGTPIWLLCG